ncbi:MAG TPA: VanZ family protein [Pyrinomonadaceae bacterium]|nr:VanZ family protein [Pyrinomonadaceae bacterium]
MSSVSVHPGPGRLSRYLPLLLWLVFISLASSDEFSASNTSRFIGPLVLWLFPNTSAETLAAIHFLVRKLAHLSEYALLGVLAARAFSGSTHVTLRQHWFLVSLALIVIYALLDEFHQSFVPSRTASLTDSLIDITGGLTALLVMRWRRAREQSSLSSNSSYNP